MAGRSFTKPRGLQLLSAQKVSDLVGLQYNCAAFFKAVGFLWTYQYMVTLAERALARHPEAKRVSLHAESVIGALWADPLAHINIDDGTLLNESVIGSFTDLVEWQRSRWPIKSANYPERLKRWISIYDETPMMVEVGKKSRKIANRARKKAGEPERAAVFMPIRIKDKDTGELITYERVIKERYDSIAGQADLAPFWFVLNYGTAPFGKRSGYPVVKGAFFVEKAEQKRAVYLERAARYYARFALRVLTVQRQHADAADARDWLHRQSLPESSFPNGSVPDLAYMYYQRLVGGGSSGDYDSDVVGFDPAYDLRDQ
jgi:hypothetical protein